MTKIERLAKTFWGSIEIISQRKDSLAGDNMAVRKKKAIDMDKAPKLLIVESPAKIKTI